MVIDVNAYAERYAQALDDVRSAREMLDEYVRSSPVAHPKDLERLSMHVDRSLQNYTSVFEQHKRELDSVIRERTT